LFGLEQLTKVKERWFREGLLNRLRCLSSFLRLRGGDVAEAEDVNISFSRSLPVNRLEVAQTVKTYEGLVPKRLLLAQVPFVEDAEAAMREEEIG
ncbi:MAG: phage portal protein, partial [Clostridia bacterium]